MKLISYDFEALVRVAQQAPWTDGLKEVRQWARDVREKGDPRGSFRAAGVFDAASLDATVARFGALHEALGGARALRELIGDDPARELVPGCSGWDAYEDLARVWTAIESGPWPDADLDGDGGLLDQLGRASGLDLRLGRGRPHTRDIGMPYPDRWHALPRAAIHHVGSDALEALASIGRSDVETAARALSLEPRAVAERVGKLLWQFELARQLDTVVAVWR